MLFLWLYLFYTSWFYKSLTSIKNNMDSILAPVITTFAILKDLIWTSITEDRIATCWNYKVMIHTLFVILSIISILAILVLVLLFAILKFVVHLHLKRTYGERYGGMLDGHVIQFEAYGGEKASIVTVMIVLVSGGVYSKFYHNLTNIISRICVDNPRLSSTVEHYFGYYFYLSNIFTWQEILSEISISTSKYMTPTQLFEYLEKYEVTSTKLWEMMIFKQPIIWNYIHSRTTYAVVLRVNQCVMDADAISGFLRQNFFDEQHPHVWKCVERRNINKLDDAYILYNPFNYLFNMELTLRTHRTQHLSAIFEDTAKYIPLIKTIKKKLDVPFSLILLAAMSSALGDSMRKKTFGWEKVNIVYNIRTNMSENNELCESRNRINTRSSFILFGISLKRKACTPLQHLKYVNEEYNYGKNALDAKLAEYLKSCVFPYLPFGVFPRSFYDDMFQRNTLYFTSFVQSDEECIQGHRIIDAFGYVPLYQNKGIMLTALTYNNKLKLSLISREGIISNREDLTEMLINTLQYIDDLCTELIIPSIENKYT